MMTVETIQIYVLQLQNNKIYVGSTTDFFRRFEQHASGKGSIWTLTHAPLALPRGILEVFTQRSSLDEDMTTLRYMASHGIDNVRGGTFSECGLRPSHRETIVAMLRTANKQCFKCGSPYHFESDCSSIHTLPKSYIAASLENIDKVIQGNIDKLSSR